MLTVIPRKQFEELLGQTLTEDVNRKFSVKDFKDFVSSSKKSNTKGILTKSLKEKQFEKEVKEYMKENSNTRFVGEGSSRISYFLPPRCISQDQSAPCCLKIAKNKAGIAQNEAERKLFQKFGNLPCFPRVFDYDSTNNLYAITEYGTTCEKMFIRAYINTWDELVEKLNVKIPRVDSYTLRMGARGFEEVDDIILYSKKCDPKQKWGSSSIFDAIMEKVVDPIVSKNDAFQTVKGLMEFANKNGYSETSPADLEYLDNWGIVIRNGEEVPLPVDWGLSWEVSDKYY